MSKYCFICGDDRCLNLFDNPLNPEDNVCDNCRHIPLDQKCPVCSGNSAKKKQNLNQILVILFFIAILIFPIIFLVIK